MINRKLQLFFTIIGGIFYLVAIGFILNIVYIVCSSFGRIMFDVSSVIPLSLFIGGPGIIGTFFLVLGQKDGNRRRFVRGFEIILFLFYLLLVFIILFGGFRAHFGNRINLWLYITHSCNLIPFRTISGYINDYFHNSINLNIIIDNLFGNLLLFTPLGLLLPSLSKRLQKWKYFMITLLLILLSLELIQLFLELGIFDIDDVILNFTGAMIVYCIIKIRPINRLLVRMYVLDKLNTN